MNRETYRRCDGGPRGRRRALSPRGDLRPGALGRVGPGLSMYNRVLMLLRIMAAASVACAIYAYGRAFMHGAF